MGEVTITFSKLVDKLQQHYGPPAPPHSTDPLELIISESIAYLASDKRRAEALGTRRSRRRRKLVDQIMKTRSIHQTRNSATTAPAI